MSTWTTKSLDRSRDYIVIKHTLRGVNYVINGIKFRGGFAVVEKNGKSHQALKKIPMLRKAVELPITHLKKLPFISKTSDIKVIYGQDVYKKFLEIYSVEQKIEKIKAVEEDQKKHLEEGIKCKFNSPTSGLLCELNALEQSPSGYCKLHILHDPRLSDLGIEFPKYRMTKEERREFRKKVINKLEKNNGQTRRSN